MPKDQKSTSKVVRASEGMPKAPWIYVWDSTHETKCPHELSAMIPEATVFRISSGNFRAPSTNVPAILSDCEHESVPHIGLARKRAQVLRDFAIKNGVDFVSVNIVSDMMKAENSDGWGNKHLNVVAGEDTANAIYKWLFTVLSVRETLHLIPAEQMKQIDKSRYPDYAYCAVNESWKHKKDAKIQFVALILSKPEITGDQKLTWSVADRTGLATFYFQHRGPQSQFTWDWVLSLKPGQKVVLPRMPMVEIKERKRVKLVKAPFRIIGATILIPGAIVLSIGQGIRQIGRTLMMGPSSEWVAAHDIGPDGKKIKLTKTDEAILPAESSLSNKTIDIFNNRGEKSWSDGASVASTDIGSDLVEKSGKDFVV